MAELKKRVAVIGGGPIGLTSAKAMLEVDLTPTIFEKENQIGGVWREHGNIWPNMKMNATKYLCTYSDFIWDSTIPLYPGAEDARRYFRSYADHFQVTPHIRLNSKVTSARQINGQKWCLKWLNTKSNTEHEDTFDFLIVASGIFSKPNIPQLENQDKFKGLIIHSKDYPNYKGTLNGKNVIVVGNCNSGADIAADLSLDGTHVLNVFHKPHWILKRNLPLDPTNPQKLIPLDFAIFSRRMTAMVAHLPTYEDRNAFKNRMLSTVLPDQNSLPSKDLYIDPDTRDSFRVAVSDNYIDCVKKGLIQTKKDDLKSCDENGVYLADGSYVQADAVIWSTGYTLNLDFFDESILKSIEYDPMQAVQPVILYKATFPRDIDNLAFTGILRDPGYPIGELQAKFAGLVFSGRKHLPDKSVIDLDLVDQRHVRTIYPMPQFVKEDVMVFMDDLASEVGVKPDFEKIKAEDEALYHAMWDSMCAPCHYQLGTNKEFFYRVMSEMKETIDKI